MNDHNIPFSIQIYSLAMLASEFIQQKLGDIGLQKQHFLYLIFPHVVPGINQDSISSYFNADKSTTARVLQKMQNSGLITREKDEKNLKSNKVYLTQKGLELNQQIISYLNEFEEKLKTEVENFDEYKDNTSKIFLKALYTRKNQK